MGPQGFLYSKSNRAGLCLFGQTTHDTVAVAHGLHDAVGRTMEVVSQLVDAGDDVFADRSAFGTVTAFDAVHEELRIIAERRLSETRVAVDGVAGLAASIHLGGPAQS
jgi:hypothetical protein